MATDAEIEVHCAENTELSKTASPLKAWKTSEYSHACLSHCYCAEDFFPVCFCFYFLITLIIFPLDISLFFSFFLFLSLLRLTWLTERSEYNPACLAHCYCAEIFYLSISSSFFDLLVTLIIFPLDISLYIFFFLLSCV